MADTYPIPLDEVNEGSDFGYTLAQLAAPDGTLIAAADVSSIDIYVYNQADPETILAPFTNISPTLEPEGPVIFTPTGPINGWDQDSTGPNFAHYLRLSDFGAGRIIGGQTYRLSYIVHTGDFDGASGNFADFIVNRDVKVKPHGATA